MCASYGSDKRHSAPYHPQGDGQVERALESVKQYLRCFLADRNLDKTNWPSVLQEVAFNINSVRSSSTGFTPQGLMFGANIKSAIDQVVGDCGEIEMDVMDQGERVKVAAENIARAKRYYDRNTVGKPTGVSVGQIILLMNFTRGDGLVPTYIGSYEVCETKYPNVKIKRGNRYSWVHLNDCKLVPEESHEFSSIHLEENIDEPEANPSQSMEEYTNIHHQRR